MIEEAVREAFARAERLVPDAASLVPAIDAESRRRRRRRRVMRSVSAVIVLALAVSLTVLGRGLLAPPDAHLLSEPLDPPADRGMNFLIAGQDHLDSQAADVPRHTDSIIVVHVSADRRATYVLSVPRDLRVDVAGLGGIKINSVYAMGSPAAFERAVSDLVGVRFDATASVDIGSLPRLVDAVGGVDLCVDVQTRSIHTGAVYEVGCRRFTGAEAKDYLRQRRDLPAGSLDRDRHVVQFLDALLQQLRSGALTDPVRLGALMVLVIKGATVDLRGHDPIGLAVQLAPALGSVVAIPVPVTSTGQPAGDTLGLGATELFTALRTDTLADWTAAHPAGATRLS